jgi:hypothetical protein
MRNIRILDSEGVTWKEMALPDARPIVKLALSPRFNFYAAWDELDLTGPSYDIVRAVYERTDGGGTAIYRIQGTFR